MSNYSTREPPNKKHNYLELRSKIFRCNIVNNRFKKRVFTQNNATVIIHAMIRISCSKTKMLEIISMEKASFGLYNSEFGILKGAQIKS